jgi:acetylornithine deacetylase
MKKCFKDALKKNAKITGFIAPADWQSLNTVKPITPTLGFGPGDMQIAHTINEFVQIDQVIKCTKVLALSILDYCGTSVK